MRRIVGSGSKMLLQLAVCVVGAIQLTSSQSTYVISDVDTQNDDVTGRCGRSTEQLLSQLVTAMGQLQRDVAELKTSQRHGATGATDSY